MKKIILSAAVLIIAFAVKAQEIPERKTDQPPMMERKMHRGMELQKHKMELQNLNLTEEQKAKFKSQREQFRQQMEELKKNDGITVREWKAKAESLRKEQKSAFENILTSDQKARIEKMKADAKEKQATMGKERADKMKAELGLSDEQADKIQTNRKEMVEKIKTIRENNSLNEEQKREQMKELIKKQRESMKTVLTEDQLKKLKETMHKRPEGQRKRPEVKQTI